MILHLRQQLIDQFMGELPRRLWFLLFLVIGASVM
ncbi:hypothetical protein K788_0002885 [Paraburkholderia caribensis MBA4]|uniref:Uncharacterized protein n=1 Tax=Paraburkholderia caribensis MBA4 TaxID=1323664 RepID=A0A0P0RD61_9BURK|nr:hypothetical protein K788_0002885 [Paraburkholderia caribensis MBA4]